MVNIIHNNNNHKIDKALAVTSNINRAFFAPPGRVGSGQRHSLTSLKPIPVPRLRAGALPR